MESDLSTSTKKMTVDGSVEKQRRTENHLLNLLSTHLIQLLWPSDRVVLGIRVCRMCRECLVAAPRLHVKINPIQAKESSAHAMLQFLDKSGRLVCDGWNIELFLERFTSKDISLTIEDERGACREYVRGCKFMDSLHVASRQAQFCAGGLRPLAAYLATLNTKVKRVNLNMAGLAVAFPLVPDDPPFRVKQLLHHLHLTKMQWFDKPPTMSAFSSLQSLSLAGCTLHEEILAAWQNILPLISNLQLLDMAYTRSFHWNPAQDLSEALGSSICCCTTLTYLDLSGFDVNDTVATGLGSLHRLRTLHLRHSWGVQSIHYHDETIPGTVMSSIARLTNLTELSVVVSSKDSTNVPVQLDAMRCWPKLSSLTLLPCEDSLDGPDFWVDVFEALELQTSLSFLALGTSNSHSAPILTLVLREHFQALAQLLLCCPRINHLELHHATLSNLNCAILGPALRQCPRLTSLDVSAAVGFVFNGPGSLALALELGSSVTKISSLNLAGCQTLRHKPGLPPFPGLFFLARAFRNPEQLGPGPGESEDQVEAEVALLPARFSALAASCVALSALILARNQLEDSAVAAALVACPTLTLLDISDNAMTCTGAVALAEAMESEGSWGRLEHLDVSGNEIKTEGLRRLAGAVGRCDGIQKVFLQKQCGGLRRAGGTDAEVVDWVRGDGRELGMLTPPRSQAEDHDDVALHPARETSLAREAETLQRVWVEMACLHRSLRYFAMDSGVPGNEMPYFHQMDSYQG